MKKAQICLFILLFLSFSCQRKAQYSDTQLQQIDSLFVSWNQPNHPGGSIGIQQNGKFIYYKAFGLANMEYLVPNTPNTAYNIASVSKQFTSMGILLLDQWGRLSIDEDIRVYLPELPDFGEKVTLRHCMHHTSGMRSLHALLGMAGWREDDARTNADLFRFMKQQKDLNFKPGAEYLYCNTGYMLMADIIERLTGEKFADWMHKNVFLPLGLTETYVEAEYNRIVSNNATSYNGSAKSGFSRATEYWGYVGSGNIHSTTQDLLNWMNNFHTPKSGWEPIFAKMKTVDLLNNGDTLHYAFGVDTKAYKGVKRIGHGGAIGGFRSNAVTFPDHQLSIVVLTNFSSANAGGKVNQIADVLLGKKADVEANKKTIQPELPHTELTQQQLKEYAGTYYSPELDTHYHFKLIGDELMGNHPRHGEFDLKFLNEDKLEASLWAFKNIEIKRNADNKIEGIFVSNGRVRNMWFIKEHVNNKL